VVVVMMAVEWWLSSLCEHQRSLLFKEIFGDCYISIFTDKLSQAA